MTLVICDLFYVYHLGEGVSSDFNQLSCPKRGVGASKLNTLNQLSLLWPDVAKHPSSELRPAASFPEVHHYIYI